MPTVLGVQPPTLLQSVLDDVGVALIIIDHNGKFVFSNHCAQEILGMTQDLKGLSLVDWRRGYKFQDAQGRDIAVENAPIVHALAGETILPQEVRVTLPDGRVKWLHAAGLGFSVLGLNGVFVVITDETEQVELRRATEQVQRIESGGALVGSLAHNFNNMLSIAMGNISLSLSDPGVPKETRTRLLQTKDALQRGAALANRLMQFSRPRESKTSPVAVNDVVNASLELVRPLLGGRVRLKLDFRDGLPVIQADPTEIEHALVNVIINALDAMPEGGELAVSTGLGPAPNADMVSKHFVSITVADTGTGIPEHLQTRIFEPFFTTKQEGRGSGLGLSSTYRTVHQHKGHIKLVSTPGVGTSFTVMLPAKDAA